MQAHKPQNVLVPSLKHFQLAADLVANRLPDMARLTARFSPDPAALPTVVVYLTPLAAYEALLDNGLGEAA